MGFRWLIEAVENFSVRCVTCARTAGGSLQDRGVVSLTQLLQARLRDIRGHAPVS